MRRRINSVKERGSHGALRSQLSTLKLLSYFLKLLTDYRTVETIDGDVKPITFFAFYHEVGQAPRFRGGCQTHERAYIYIMSLAEIKSAVRELSPKELAELTAFISDQDNAVWSEQIEQDAASGKLDFLFQEADDERQAGKLRNWPEDK